MDPREGLSRFRFRHEGKKVPFQDVGFNEVTTDRVRTSINHSASGWW